MGGWVSGEIEGEAGGLNEVLDFVKWVGGWVGWEEEEEKETYLCHHIIPPRVVHPPTHPSTLLYGGGWDGSNDGDEGWDEAAFD